MAALQRDLLNDPRLGAVIPGCGGLRKLRLAEPKRGSGKRGGARVIYLLVEEARVIYLMDVYRKGEQANLTTSQRKVLTRLAGHYREEAIRRARAPEDR